MPATDPVARAGFRPTEAHYRSMLETTNSAVVGLSPDRKILYWNRGAERAFGYSEAEVIGRDYFELVLPPEQWDAVADYIQHAMLGSVGRNYETPVRTRDRSERILIWNASQITDDRGRAVGIFAIGQDITPLKRAQEERLRESEDRFRTAVEELEELRAEVRERFSFQEIVAVSPPMLKVLQLAAQVAPTDATVLITGETGTGKEVLARAIHANSPRKMAPFVAVNCGAIPETLIESELFGHERGAFTGADRRKPGRIERAAGGILFLDEVGELPPQAQVKLLRVLQERVFERLGGTEPLQADVRIVAATNRDLAADAEAGRFRDDLFYRLNVFHIHIPPLRERRPAIPVLAERILQKIAARMRRPEIGLSKLALELLQNYEWKGNVRELENALERAAILCGGSLIRPEHLPIQPLRPAASARVSAPGEVVVRLGGGFSMDRLETELIALALKQARGNQSEAARLLGISRGALRWRMQKRKNGGAQPAAERSVRRSAI
ncbi:MAG: sigma 54-interacting transcriptional regulator [Bryobacteraceae bacterium]|nr:sigma 54-interacting transcriptional regulator [Bryobacteraceae bacterium]